MIDFIEICKDEKLLKYFKVGDIIVIKQCPTSWSSLSGGSSPFQYNINFPYTAKIVKIDYCPDKTHISFYDGTYGWSLTQIIKENIFDSLIFLRKQKLEKLYLSQEIE